MMTEIEVVRKSQLTGNYSSMTIKLDPNDYENWLSGNALIQNVLHYLTPDEREFLMTGITPEEWEAAFG